MHSLALLWINVTRLCKALIFHLQSSPFRAPDLMPVSPFVDYEATIQASRVTVTELRKHLGLKQLSSAAITWLDTGVVLGFLLLAITGPS